MLVFLGDAVVNNQWEGGTLWQRQLSKLLCKIVEYHSTQAHSWHLQRYWVSLAGSNLGGPCLSSSWVAQMVKCPLTMWKTQVQSLGREDPLEKEMATHSSTLAWKIPWMEEPDRLQSMALQRVRHDWVTSLCLSSSFKDFIPSSYPPLRFFILIVNLEAVKWRLQHIY